MKPDCVGCGYCCLTAPCLVAVLRGVVLKHGVRCPYLYWGGTRYWCGLAGTMWWELDLEEGCCSSLNTWRKDVRFRG